MNTRLDTNTFMIYDESILLSTRCFPANPQTIVKARPSKFYEPKANHVGCFANAFGGEARRAPPNPPPAVYMFKPTFSARSAHPDLKRLHLQLKPQKKSKIREIP